MFGKKLEILMPVVHRLILETSSLNNIGLYDGKIGIAIFFAHFSRFTHKEIYRDFACALIEEVSADLYNGYSYNMEFGLCGIGFGIEYLIQNNLLEADSDEILADMDASIMLVDLDRITDYSLEKGIMGILTYVYVRLNTVKRDKEKKRPFDSAYLNKIIRILSYVKKTNPDPLIHKFLHELNGLIEENRRIPTLPLLSDAMKTSVYRENKKSLGLRNGLAGSGLKIMMQ